MFRRSCLVPASRPVPNRAAGTIGRHLSRQAARPHGPFGWLLGRIWLRETAAVNDVALGLLGAAPGDRVCEIGFGPGRTLALLAAAGAEVQGVEVSPRMVATAARRNAAPISEGRMRLQRGDGTHLPLPGGGLDAVLAVHNLYFWPDVHATLADIARVLRPGGRLVLVSVADDHPLPARFDRAVYRVPGSAELAGWIRDAGFVDVRVERRSEIPAAAWFTATAA